MIALKWSRDMLLDDGYVLRAATVADAAGVAALMSEPDVEQWWHQDWGTSRWEECLRGLIDDAGSLPLVLAQNGGADGDKISGGRAQSKPLQDSGVAGYVEVYQVAGDVLGRHIPHKQTDLGMHIALGRSSRGKGLGKGVIRSVLGAAGEILEGCNRLVAEPDVRNRKSVRAFAAAGLESGGTVQLPDKTARLMEGRPNAVTEGRDVEEPGIGKRSTEKRSNEKQGAVL